MTKDNQELFQEFTKNSKYLLRIYPIDNLARIRSWTIHDLRGAEVCKFHSILLVSKERVPLAIESD